jgi:hypothetical protein
MGYLRHTYGVCLESFSVEKISEQMLGSRANETSPPEGGRYRGESAATKAEVR